MYVYAHHIYIRFLLKQACLPVWFTSFLKDGLLHRTNLKYCKHRQQFSSTFRSMLFNEAFLIQHLDNYCVFWLFALPISCPNNQKETTTLFIGKTNLMTKNPSFDTNIKFRYRMIDSGAWRRLWSLCDWKGLFRQFNCFFKNNTLIWKNVSRILWWHSNVTMGKCRWCQYVFGHRRTMHWRKLPWSAETIFQYDKIWNYWR